MTRTKVIQKPETDQVILAMQSGNIKRSHAAILDFKKVCEPGFTEKSCELLREYLHVAINRADAFAVFQLLNCIPSGLFSAEFMGSSKVIDIINAACTKYQQTFHNQNGAMDSSLQVIAMLISPMKDGEFCFSAEKVAACFKGASIIGIHPTLLQKRSRYQRAIFWAEELSLRVEADAKFAQFVSEELRLKNALHTFVIRMDNYLTSLTDAELVSDGNYNARIKPIENFMVGVDMAYPQQTPTVFVSTFQDTLATARSTISNEAGRQSPLSWLVGKTWNISRCAAALESVEGAFKVNVANADNFKTCGQQGASTNGTQKNTFMVRGF